MKVVWLEKPRSGTRIQPMAQAVGAEAKREKAPQGRKKHYPRDGGRDAGATNYYIEVTL
jgi:hypothetical protein